jgi:Tol biopolymer transport system component
MAFVVTAGGVDKLWIRPLDSLNGKELPGTNDARYPFWSPDSRSLGFFAAGKINRIDVAGGLPVALCESSSARGGSWSSSGVILFSPNAGPLQQVAASGGRPVPATRIDTARGENSHRWPHFLPDGRRFLYFVRTAQRGSDGVYLGSLDRAEEKIRLITSTTNATYSPGLNGRSGHLLWVSDGRLLAQPFDPVRAKLSGEPHVIAENILTTTNAGYYSASHQGTILYARAQDVKSQPVWYSREAKSLGAAGPTGSYQDLAISPDGNRIAVIRQETSGETDIWLIEASLGTPVRLTLHGGRHPVWSPDGRRIAFERSTPTRLFAIDTDGAGHEEPLMDAVNGVLIPHSWSPDGKFLLHTYYSYGFDAKTRNDLWLVPLTGDRKPAPLLQSEFQEIRGQFSPDGKWVSYTSDQSGQNEIYVQTFPANGAKRQVSANGGDFSHWRKDGKELFYRSPSGKLMQ